MTLPMRTLDAAELAEFRQSVRAAVSASDYPARVRALEDSGDGIDVDLWRLLAEDIGLAGLGLPEEVGGLGGLVELLGIAEELGATLAPVPFISSTVLCGQILGACGEAAAPYLERIVAGEVASAAITDPKGAWQPSNASLCTSDGTTVTGSVRFVPYGAAASFFVVAAKTASGLEVFAVEASDAQVQPLRSLDFSRPSSTVSFAAAPAVALTRGEGQAAVDAGVIIALLATGADQLGGAQQCFDMTLDYIKLRRQFNREIGSFQAVKHRVADALMLVEMSRSGIERVTSGACDDLALEASVVKAWSSDAYQAITAETIQLHGGVGFTWEHDSHLYFRRARYDSAFLGDATFHRERVATLLDW